jgi:hypothetical protein
MKSDVTLWTKKRISNLHVCPAMLFLLLLFKSYISGEGNIQNGGQNSLGYGRTDERTLD